MSLEILTLSNREDNAALRFNNMSPHKLGVVSSTCDKEDDEQEDASDRLLLSTKIYIIYGIFIKNIYHFQKEC